MTDKEKFIKIATENISREGIGILLEKLDKTDFYTAPASTRYHDSVEGGLVSHSLKVYYALLRDATGRFDNESIAITSLFHDVCKMGFYTVEMRNSKVDGKWIKVPYYAVDDKFAFGHGEKSVYLINDCMKLTTEEATAIRFHMGAYEGEKIWETLATAYTQCPLALYLHIADMKATYLPD